MSRIPGRRRTIETERQVSMHFRENLRDLLIDSKNSHLISSDDFQKGKK